jgi:hypothetical protein
MLNEKPIFLNCFARGGSNLLVNLLLSHPYICNSSGETHKVFKPGTPFDKGWLRIKKRFFYDYPIRLIVGQDIFNPFLLNPRKPVPFFVRERIDRLFYEGRFLNKIPEQNLYQYEGVEYTDEELAKCRLLTKGINGLVYTVELFREMYPDAVFIALTRNGLAICEGRYRRHQYPPEKMAHEYKLVIEQMLKYEREMPNYHIMRYEDMASDPIKFVRKLYSKVGLDIEEVLKFRLESRPIMTANGTHRRIRGSYDRQLFWYKLEELNQHIKSDINKNQLKNLNPKVKDRFLIIAEEVMQRLGYTTYNKV